MALTEAMELEVDRREPEEVEEENSEEEPSPKETASKKCKASTQLQCSKKKKHRLEVLSGAEVEFVTDEQASATRPTPDEAIKPETHIEPEVSKTDNKGVFKYQNPAAANKADNSWTKIKNDSGWNKWANNGFVVHLKGSALGPTLKCLRSTKKHWLC